MQKEQIRMNNLPQKKFGKMNSVFFILNRFWEEIDGSTSQCCLQVNFIVYTNGRAWLVNNCLKNVHEYIKKNFI